MKNIENKEILNNPIDSKIDDLWEFIEYKIKITETMWSLEAEEINKLQNIISKDLLEDKNIQKNTPILDKLAALSA